MDVLSPDEFSSLFECGAFESKDKEKIIFRTDFSTQDQVQKWLRSYKDATSTDYIVKDPMSETPVR